MEGGQGTAMQREMRRCGRDRRCLKANFAMPTTSTAPNPRLLSIPLSPPPPILIRLPLATPDLVCAQEMQPEIAVINDELLRQCVEEQAPEAVKAYGQQQSGASDSDVLLLRLDFRSALEGKGTGLKSREPCPPKASCASTTWAASRICASCSWTTT